MTENSEYAQEYGVGPPNRPSALTATEERLHLLESQVQTLAQAVRALAQGLEENPAQEIQDQEERQSRGARLAHEILLAQGM